jgi:hypothetical protein
MDRTILGLSAHEDRRDNVAGKARTKPPMKLCLERRFLRTPLSEAIEPQCSLGSGHTTETTGVGGTYICLLRNHGKSSCGIFAEWTAGEERCKMLHSGGLKYASTQIRLRSL